MIIGIIGAGFSGTALTALLHRFTTQACEVYLFDKTGCFGQGEAYRTPYPHHLLNVRAGDMSAYEDQPGHFVEWLKTSSVAAAYLDKDKSINTQFVPRLLYGLYLQHLLQLMQATHTKNWQLHLESSAVVAVKSLADQAILILQDQREIRVDKVVLAIGNNPPINFPFAVDRSVNVVANPWDYTALQSVPQQDPVLIVGTGLSMIDAVLTLHQQKHQAPIYAVSRHGLLPLAHTNFHSTLSISLESLPSGMRQLTKYLRQQSQAMIQAGGDWRAVISAIRPQIATLWGKASLQDKKRFLRHVLAYWNIHRHRVHDEIAGLLAQLAAQQQLVVLSGRVLRVEQTQALIQPRHAQSDIAIPIKHLVNCMGPAPTMKMTQQPLIQSLVQQGLATFDSLQLGFATGPEGGLQEKSGRYSSLFYTLGPPRRGEFWELTAVPEIRKQCYDLAKQIVGGAS